MRLTTKGFVALASSGIVLAALTGCSQSSNGNTTQPGAGSSSSSSAASSATPSASPTPALDTEVGGKTTQITLDAGFAAALKSLKLTPGVIGSATLKGGVLTFPITGGHVTYYDPSSHVRPYVQGELDHTGSGLSLTAGSTKVDLKNFVIDPGNNSHVSGDVYLNGKSVVKGANLFRLDGSTLNPVTMSDGAYILEGTTVYISSDAAALLNSTFKTKAVTDQLKVGIAKLTVTAKS